MDMFRPAKGGGVIVGLSGGEATLLRTLLIAVTDLLGSTPRPGTKPADTATAAPDAVLDDLERLFAQAEEPPPQIPDDPVLARLLPDAYRDDPEAAGEFRKYTESSLREAKKYFAQTMLETLPPEGGRIKLTADQARDWMRALNDIRLMFGVRLEVQEDFEEQLATLAPDDPKVAAFEVYAWLGGVQESLVRALSG
jgi:hypothetical protein